MLIATTMVFDCFFKECYIITQKYNDYRVKIGWCHPNLNLKIYLSFPKKGMIFNACVWVRILSNMSHEDKKG